MWIAISFAAIDANTLSNIPISGEDRTPSVTRNVTGHLPRGIRSCVNIVEAIIKAASLMDEMSFVVQDDR